MNEEEPQSSLEHQDLGWILCFEVGLGVLALVCGYLTVVWPAARLTWPITLPEAVLGFASALPPLAVMLGIQRLPWTMVREMQQLVDEKLMPLFRQMSLFELLLLSLAAGWGEELLFRGLIQAEVAHHTNLIVGILIASFVFGLLHFLSIAYFLMAFAISIYFGWLYAHFESLWLPIMGHATYDFLILVIMQRRDESAALPDATQATN